VQLAGQVAAADQRAYGCAGDHRYGDLSLVERSQHADMGPAARRASAEREGDGCAVSVARCGFCGWWLECSGVAPVIGLFARPIEHHELLVLTPGQSVAGDRIKIMNARAARFVKKMI